MPSPIDQLYYEIFGNLPTKPGTAYEKFAAAAMKLLQPMDGVFHDARLRGALSKSIYQIDVLASKGQVAGEAKDYTDQPAKVGRPDLQKLGGALPDLPVNSGAFFSATSYTKPARQYAGAASNIVGKPIELFELRPSVESDLTGRIKKITIRFHIITPDYQRARFEAVFTEDGHNILTRLKKLGQFVFDDQPSPCENILKADGSVLITIGQLSSGTVRADNSDRMIASWPLPGGHISIDKSLVPIHGITFDIPFNKQTKELSINANGRAVLLLKSLDGKIDKIISDVDLKRISFGKNGEAKLNS